MAESDKLARRGAVRTAAASSMAVPYFVSAAALGQAGQPGANDKLNIALIGCGGMGRGNLANCCRHPDVAVVGACDVWKERREATAAAFQDTCKPYSDYREVLAQKDIDGVIIATPPHWHALIAIEAAEAGKDFYVQKPMTMYLDEALAVRRAAEQHQRITQVGTQIHAGANYRRVVEWVRSGRLGQIAVVRTFLTGNQGVEGLGNPPNSDPPAGHGLEPVGRPRPDAAVQPADRGQRPHELLVHGLQRRLHARHGPAHHRPAVLGAGAGHPAQDRLLRRALRDPRRRRRLRHPAGPLAVSEADRDLDAPAGQQLRLRSARGRQRRSGGGWASISTAWTRRCTPTTARTRSSPKAIG